MQRQSITSASRSTGKRVGRGGKRGTTSGGGTKGQKGRAGASVRPGFRGGDNRIWQLFPKQRGATKKHGSKRVHRKHRRYQVIAGKPAVINVAALNAFSAGDSVTLATLKERRLISGAAKAAKILGTGEVKVGVTVEGVDVSTSAREKITAAGGTVA